MLRPTRPLLIQCSDWIWRATTKGGLKLVEMVVTRPILSVRQASAVSSSVGSRPTKPLPAAPGCSRR